MFIDLFPTILFHKFLKDISFQELNSYIKFILDIEKNELSDNPHGFGTKDQNILNFPIFSKIKKHILSYSKFYLENLGYKGFDIQISTSWGNVMYKNHHIPSHEHSNSLISGVFYPNDSSSILFHDPTEKKWTFKTNKEFDINNVKTWEFFNFNPKAGDLIIFPSWLYHGVKNNKQDNRVSIAFNIAPKGEFGNITSKIYF